jgi:hypothetical protein
MIENIFSLNIRLEVLTLDTVIKQRQYYFLQGILSHSSLAFRCIIFCGEQNGNWCSIILQQGISVQLSTTAGVDWYIKFMSGG